MQIQYHICEKLATRLLFHANTKKKKHGFPIPCEYQGNKWLKFLYYVGRSNQWLQRVIVQE